LGARVRGENPAQPPAGTGRRLARRRARRPRGGAQPMIVAVSLGDLGKRAPYEAPYEARYVEARCGGARPRIGAFLAGPSVVRPARSATARVPLYRDVIARARRVLSSAVHTASARWQCPL